MWGLARARRSQRPRDAKALEPAKEALALLEAEDPKAPVREKIVDWLAREGR